MQEHIAEWQAAISWMRAAGVCKAAWDSDGNLLSATLGTDPTPPRYEAQRPPRPSPENTVAEKRRVMLASSGRLVEVPRVK